MRTTNSGLACVYCVYLFRFIELCTFLCCLVFVRLYVSQEIGWEDYSHDIFCVEGFPLKDQI